MSKINDFLTEAGVFYLATTEGAQPKIRPLSAHHEMDGKLIFGVGSHKNVYRQLLVSPLVEIVSFHKGHWLRYSGKAVFETDDKYEKMALEESSFLKNSYNETTGNHMMMFHLEDATALLLDGTGKGDVIDD